MKAILFSYFIAFVVAASAARAPDTNIQDLLLPLTRSNGYFAAKLYNAVKGNTENILISPLTINYALTGLTLGAAGYTLKELKIVLNQPEHESLIVSSYGLFAAMLKFDKNLTVATKLYADTLFPLNKSYQAEMKYFFLAEVDNANFSGDPERARHIINEYVDHNTDHLIRELLSVGSINKATPSIIVNAVHFESEWEHPFERTDNKPFHGFHKIFHVEMMHHSQMVLSYAQDNALKAQLLELPYTGGYSFLVILPNDKNGLSEVERKLISRANNPNASPFIDIFKQTKPVAVDVSLPKFKFEQTNNLRNALKKMGLNLIFTSSANFQKISNQPLFIGDIAQKTFISVNEKGTEAAAATAILLRNMSLNVPSPPTFNADHPFIYIVKHELSETPLFIGRYAHP